MKIIKIKAGALQLVMFITVVIALLLTSFVVFVNSHKRFSAQTDFLVDVLKNTNKGMQYALKTSVPLNKMTTFNEGDFFKEVTVKKEFWGIFEKITATSSIKNKTHKRIALVGVNSGGEERTALYLNDNNKPLVVVGDTRIKGDVYLPSQGVRTGNISGTSYYGSKLIYGNTKLSHEFPQVLNEVSENIKGLLENIQISESNNFIDLIDGLKYERSFHKTTSIFYDTKDIHLLDVTLIGNIIVKSASKIVVDASSKLRDVLLIAPEIVIKNNVQTRVQAIASKRISVGENCQLYYPSALVLKNDEINSVNKNNENSNIVEVKSNTVVSGLVFYKGRWEKNNFNPQVLIEKNATIKGELYCNKNIELNGTVLGSVYANNFIARQSGSIYQNHIYNGVIDIDKLPEQYTGLLLNANSNKDIIKWLY